MTYPPYPEEIVQPMRDELTEAGFRELTTAQEVDEVLSQKSGTTLVMVNSVCGCAASQARPGVIQALANSKNKPGLLTSVFAGQEPEATARARSYFDGYPPSSPSVALFKDGELVYMMERTHIETRSAETISVLLREAFDHFCS